MDRYFASLVDAHREMPGEDLLSAMVTDDRPDSRSARQP
jgi:hypothetical protein